LQAQAQAKGGGSAQAASEALAIAAEVRYCSSIKKEGASVSSAVIIKPGKKGRSSKE